MIRLENWKIVAKNNNPYTAPECIKRYLSGNVYNDARFPDGCIITTSSLQEFDFDKLVAKTRNTEYKLGKIDGEYMGWLEKNNIKLDDIV